MMPIFFHAESHLWVFYLFFVNGLLCHYCLALVSPSYRQLTNPFEAKVIAALGLSMGLNGGLLYWLSLLGVSWGGSLPILICVTGCGALSLMLLIRRSGNVVEWLGDLSILRVILYAFVWMLLFHNGGLIEQVSDAWWHMALADRMIDDAAFVTEAGHLNGVGQRDYPPLLHANLALASIVSDEPMPVLWNSLTAWAASVKVMAYYLFVFGLSRHRGLAILAALFFVLVPGMGVSYLRVSAWPSHFAYTFMFAGFYLAFRFFDDEGAAQRSNSNALSGLLTLVSLLRRNVSLVLSGVTTLVLIYLTHRLELVWLAVGLGVYIVALNLYFLRRHAESIESYPELMLLLNRLLLLLVVTSSVYLVVVRHAFWHNNLDLLLAYLLPGTVAAGYLLLAANSPKWLVAAVLGGTVLLLVGSVNFQHFRSLFFPLEVLPAQTYAEMPLIAEGYLGGRLFAPGWHLQLRSALLFSGILSVPLALILAWSRPSRLSIFLASNAVIAVLFCLSPYLYQWLISIMNYHSPWRILTLLFTPAILAAVVVNALSSVKS